MAAPLQARVQGVPTPVDDLVAGMVIAEEVRDQQGRLLMPAGTALTDRHLRAFSLWGIMTIRVRGEGGADAEEAPLELTPEQVAEAEAIVRARFPVADLDHPFMAELLRLAALREARRLALEGRRHG
ncbi:MAG: hypothetical protein IPI38_05825 [Gemmatimonadetes bacterium]|nr:hypothetical protein [Gemmatimonadota bacterium]MBP9201967.1 hypothetical protein [Gemmatimonadales bacterium]MBK6778335.1 hypothetical protein [Gemmatimonadota bacterium]MBK7349355.1 hypothetical protein [Gemmatimonadota bacterium]MBK7714923.1 hypothetical protein [Gemmatimonadota bacterium]